MWSTESGIYIAANAVYDLCSREEAARGEERCIEVEVHRTHWDPGAREEAQSISTRSDLPLVTVLDGLSRLLS